jgi:uncharacterized protein YutE (UPF0331/DUF86 family)
MNTDEFTSLHDNLEENINEIQSLLRIKDLLENPGHSGKFERMRYLFSGVVKALIDIGHGVILENDLRDPLNRADIFISLAEHDIMMPSVVPGVKKAVLTLPKINDIDPAEASEIIGESIEDLYKCLDSFVVYFGLKGKEQAK